MPFNTLLLTECFLPGQTHYKESGVEISLQPESGETVLFFSIDDQSNPNCKFRQLLGIDKDNQNICDLIVFYAKDNQRMICFVELKGSDLGRAVKQVCNTDKFLRQKLNESSSFSNLTAKAFIKLKGSIPQEHRRYQEELIKHFGDQNFDIGRTTDFGQFLRGIVRQSKGKRKGKRNKTNRK
ncbi:hypothetical protein [Coleofasciculus sp.]|uniref:hypothetical protein n=1 Tax=Coleofasciculus sp. TaxID=3100458 RepID=UPI0039F864A9